jgi:AAA+ ATPase superfamily predicted ATPase
MFRKEFVDRRKELEFLDMKYKERGFEFVIVSGRRRTGKSRLLKEFVKDKENIFLLCEERRWQYNLSKFNKAVGEYFGIPKPNFNSFSDCFDFIVKQKREREKLIVVIDEFSYLIRRSDIIAEFQAIVDEILSEEEIMLILSGSAVSMMKKRVMGYKSPLYGRSTGQIFLQPLRFRDLREWFPKAKIEDLVKIYAVCDGIPKYLEFFSGNDVEKEIRENVFNPESFLFREPKLILEEELREPETYFQILEAISSGHTKVVEIANYSFLEAKDVSSYLSILEDIGFVKKEHSVLDKRRVRGIYRMKDNFFAFWFRFISSYFSELETWVIEGAWSDFKREFNSHLGFTFEKIAMEFLVEKKPFPFHRIGRWWHRDKEIDMVALNEETKEIVFVEAKWSDLQLGEARKIMADLKEKSRFVNWDNEERIEHFGLIAKRIEGKEELMAEGYLCYDLEDIKKNKK